MPIVRHQKRIRGCLGDLNSDGVVNGADLGIVLANWTDNGCNDCNDLCDECRGDLNGDCKVDGEDLGQLLAQWSECSCDGSDGPEEETIKAANEGDYIPLFLWLVGEGKEDLAYELLEVTGQQQ